MNDQTKVNETSSAEGQSRLNDGLERMVRKAGWSGIYTQWVSPTERESMTVPVTPEQVKKFAELIAAEEREAIVALAASQGWAMKNEDPFEDAVRDICTMRSNVEVSGRPHLDITKEN
jgi:hypothetical protein